jgi:hypothetical protein
MPVSSILVAALLIAAWALWVRRSSWGCRWEGGPTIAMFSAAMAAYLCSPHASKRIGTPIHTLTGWWNVEDYLGHMFGVLGACVAVYMCLVRLADLESVQAYYTQWVVRPVTVTVVLMQAAWVLSPAGESPAARFESLEASPWLVSYWTLVCGTAIYLLAFAGRIVWHLRGMSVIQAALNMYLVTFGMTIAFLALLHWNVVTPFDIRNVAWTLGYLCVCMWAITPAYSWLRRSKRLNIPNTLPVDSGANRAKGITPSAAGDSDD